MSRTICSSRAPITRVNLSRPFFSFFFFFWKLYLYQEINENKLLDVLSRSNNLQEGKSSFEIQLKKEYELIWKQYQF